MLLQRRPNQKAAVLAEELGVSIRTLHRYIGMLDEMGIPVYSERGPYGGFSLVRGYKMPPLVLNHQEAVAVYLGTSLVEEMWGRLYQEAARGALAKLDNLLPEEQRHEVAWAQRALIATGFHRTDIENMSPLLEKFRRGIRERRRLGITYRSRSFPHPVQRDLDPYALVHRWGWWYGVGHCHLRNAIRTFRIDRILELTLLDVTYDLPEGFDIHQYLSDEPYTQPQVFARLRFLPQGVGIAMDNRTFWEEMEEKPNGSLEVVFAAADMEWAVSTVLSYSGLAVALEPEELCQLVKQRAEAIVALHQGKVNTCVK
jgi:predicted DNA-binding transcriptional regulator YafY